MFFDNLEEICKKNNTTPTTILKQLNISTGNITRWKNGSDVKGETLLKLSTHFNVPIEYLLTGKKGEALTEEDKRILRLYKKLPQNTKQMVDMALAQVEEQEQAKQQIS